MVLLSLAAQGGRSAALPAPDLDSRAVAACGASASAAAAAAAAAPRHVRAAGPACVHAEGLGFIHGPALAVRDGMRVHGSRTKRAQLEAPRAARRPLRAADRWHAPAPRWPLQSLSRVLVSHNLGSDTARSHCRGLDRGLGRRRVVRSPGLGREPLMVGLAHLNPLHRSLAAVTPRSPLHFLDDPGQTSSIPLPDTVVRNPGGCGCHRHKTPHKQA
jgi:hypothetical protein